MKEKQKKQTNNQGTKIEEPSSDDGVPSGFSSLEEDDPRKYFSQGSEDQTSNQQAVTPKVKDKRWKCAIL